MVDDTLDPFNLEYYDYELPETLIAQEPLEERELCRLLVLDRKSRRADHRSFKDIGEYLVSGDVLVLNDTKVVPARLFGTKASGGKIEVLVLEPFKSETNRDATDHLCLLKSAKPPKVNTRIKFKEGLEAIVLTPPANGRAMIRFLSGETISTILEKHGSVPLPPYISRSRTGPTSTDSAYYQTVYAKKPGSVAAPTAGLHFSESLLEEIRGRGVEIVRVTLHVGYGTFVPIRDRDIRCHEMHAEFADLSETAAQSIVSAKREGRRVIAVGTTCARILEWVALNNGNVACFSGYCSLYIYPGFEFRVVDAMITNFHLPKSSLVILLSAFAGRDLLFEAYRQAIERGYRFFSYGDAMLVL